VISRRYHAKDDKEAIAAWNLDLNKIRRVFDVRPVTPLRPPLTARFQTELGIDTRATGSDATTKHTAAISDVHRDVINAETIGSGVRHDDPNTQPIVSGVQSDITSTRTTASDIYRSKLKSREGADGQNWAVSATRTLSPSKYLPLHSLTLGQRSRLQLNPVSDIYIQRTRRVTAPGTGKYPWNHSQYPARHGFRGSSRRCEDSNHGFRHSWHAEKSARGW